MRKNQSESKDDYRPVLKLIYDKEATEEKPDGHKIEIEDISLSLDFSEREENENKSKKKKKALPKRS